MSIQFHRYRNYHASTVFKIKNRSVLGYPPVAQQAEELGGTFTKIGKGLPEKSVANFSPSLINHRGSKLIAWRSQPEFFCFRHDMKYFYYNNTPTDIWVGELLNDSTIIASRKLRPQKHRLSYEDPRIFITPDDSLHCQFVTSTYATKWDSTNHSMLKTPKVCTGVIDEYGQLRECFYPRLGKNFVDGASEKNWCFFSDEDKLRLLYSVVPLTIKTPGEPDKVIDTKCLEQVTGKHPTFNSTAPILLEDEWLVFFHWKHMVQQIGTRPYLQYSLGACTLDRDLTKVTSFTGEALFVGSTNDDLITWTDAAGNDISNQPACILPFSCYLEDQDELVMAVGVNDSFMGVFRTPVVNILSLMTRV